MLVNITSDFTFQLIYYNYMLHIFVWEYVCMNIFIKTITNVKSLIKIRIFIYTV